MNIIAEQDNSISNRHAPAIYIGKLPSSPIGPMWVAVSGMGLIAIDWDLPQVDFVHQLQHQFPADVLHDESRTSEPARQLMEYLAGHRRQFDLPLDLSHMSPFQVRVLHLTSSIPYGQTSTYKEIATRLGNPNAARAVGRVEATNPIPLVIPCHRVLGTDGSLHGYGGPGGIKLKAWLLELEHARP
jgi:methylated-DNA-[protein]-cysteine S-methyltransferase